MTLLPCAPELGALQDLDRGSLRSRVTMAEATDDAAPTAPPAGWETPWPAADDAKRVRAAQSGARAGLQGRATAASARAGRRRAGASRRSPTSSASASATARRAQAERTLLQQLVSARFGSGATEQFGGAGDDAGGAVARDPQVHAARQHVPGGVNNLMGLIIGPRGKTQQRLQEETNTVVAIRGRGTKKLADATPTAEDDEPMFVKITGESEAACRKCLAMIETLIDFTSDEGQQFRDQQTRLLHQLNGTIREDERAVVDYKRILFEGKKATVPGGAFGSAAPLRPGGGAAPQGFVAAGAIGGTAAPEVSAMQAGLAAIDALAAAPRALAPRRSPSRAARGRPRPRPRPPLTRRWRL